MIFDIFCSPVSPEAHLLESQQQAIRSQSSWECQLKLTYGMGEVPERSVPTGKHRGLGQREFSSLPTSAEGGACVVMATVLFSSIFCPLKKQCVHRYVEADAFSCLFCLY